MEESKESTFELRAIAEVDPEYERLIAPLSTAEYGALKTSIRKHGLLVPIVISEVGVIIDGHHRYRACMELDIQPRFLVRRFTDKAGEKSYAIEANLLRRHANNFVRCRIALTHLEPLEKERAHARRLAGLKNVGDSLSKNLADGQQSSGLAVPLHAQPPETGEVLEILARHIGTSSETLRRARHLLQAAPAELISQLEAGEVSINAAFEQVRQSDFTGSSESNDSSKTELPESTATRTKKPPIVTLPSELFDSAIQTIKAAQGRGLDRVGVFIDKRKVTSVVVIADDNL